MTSEHPPLPQGIAEPPRPSVEQEQATELAELIALRDKVREHEETLKTNRLERTKLERAFWQVYERVAHDLANFHVRLTGVTESFDERIDKLTGVQAALDGRIEDLNRAAEQIMQSAAVAAQSTVDPRDAKIRNDLVIDHLALAIRNSRLGVLALILGIAATALLIYIAAKLGGWW